MKLGTTLWKDFWRDDRGQSTTEYILMLSVVVMVAMQFRKTFLGKMKSAVDKLGANIDGEINAGAE